MYTVEKLDYVPAGAEIQDFPKYDMIGFINNKQLKEEKV